MATWKGPERVSVGHIESALHTEQSPPKDAQKLVERPIHIK